MESEGISNLQVKNKDLEISKEYIAAMQQLIILIVFVITVVAGSFWIQSEHSFLDKKALVLKSYQYVSYNGVNIEASPHQKRNAMGKASLKLTPFTRYEGNAIGLEKHLDFSALHFTSPFTRTSSIASGDFNNDGWQDIILGNRKGILLYKNLGISRFALQKIIVPEIEDLSIIVVAFVDISNDGWQDIYVTSYGGRNYFILNDKKGFQNPKVIPALNEKTQVPQAVSFGDINKNGYLDFVNGNAYSFPKQRIGYPADGANKIITNTEFGFLENTLLEKIIGPTLGVLLSDYTNDDNLDLIIGNDSSQPDIFYKGSSEKILMPNRTIQIFGFLENTLLKKIIGPTLGVLLFDYTNDDNFDLIIGNDSSQSDIFYKGSLEKILMSDKIIPLSVISNMGMDVADFNNDLYMDIYLAGISLVNSSEEIVLDDYCFEIIDSTEKQKCENNLKIGKIIREGDIEECFVLQNPRDKNDCIVMITMKMAVENRDENFCKKIPENYEEQFNMCHGFFTSKIATKNYSKNDILQKNSGNVLLQGSKMGRFQDVADNTNSAQGGWSWNAKFADLDNDEWQDIYIANGRWVHYRLSSNVFFHNHSGQFFEAEQEKFNLENFNMVVAYTYIDIDNDGDLDIITAGHNGPINVYINNETKNNSITFEFRDEKGNFFGIGNKVYIYYGKDSERHQVRQIKLGGGFLSFDSPIAHFGLGKYNRVNRVEIVWSTGEKTTLDKEFLANKKYVVKRQR